MNNDPQFFNRLVEPGPADLVATFGGEGTGPGLFQDASGVAVDGNGIVYVSDKTARRVQKFDLDGTFLSEWSFEVAQAYGSGRIAADRAGHLYMVWADKIIAYDGADGKQLAVFSSHRDGSFMRDSFDDVTVLPDGSVLAMGGLISEDMVHFAADGTVLARIEKPLRKQNDQSEIETHLAVDGLGDIFVIGHSSNVVYHFAPDGKYLNQFGSVGDASDQFATQLGDIAIDNQSRVYVGDWKGIQVFEPTGRYVGRISKRGTTVPGELAFSDKNDLFVATGWGKQVLKYTLKKPADAEK
jgi:sugar lactone lactonase YvrE